MTRPKLNLNFEPDAVSIRNGHFIGGHLVDGGETISVLRPSDNQPYADLPVGSSEVVDEAVRSAHQAFRQSSWATCAPRDRARALRKWADLIESRSAELSRVEAVGSTRPINDAFNWDVPFTAEGIRFFAEFADKMGGDVAATRSDNLGLIISEPYGVVAAIAPWNFPLSTASWKLGPALAAGNAVVLKPSELTPFSTVCLAELAIEAGIPAGIFNVVQGTGNVTGDALCRHPNVAKVSFTGSTQIGEQIMSVCATSGIKPVTLELGGKSPQVVFSDIESIEKVAETISRSILGNAGQVCVAGSRLIAHRRIFEKLIGQLVKLSGNIIAGKTWDHRTNFPPIISATQASRIDTIVRASIKEGANAIIGGHRMSRFEDGAYYEPTILANVSSTNSAVKQEIFGPVLTVQTFEDDDEAIHLANDTVYGLAAGVYTTNLGRAMNAVRKIQAGTVWVNRYGRTADFILPTGGFHKSGIGKDLGRQAVEANLRVKATLIDFAK